MRLHTCRKLNSGYIAQRLLFSEQLIFHHKICAGLVLISGHAWLMHTTEQIRQDDHMIEASLTISRISRQKSFRPMASMLCIRTIFCIGNFLWRQALAVQLFASCVPG